MCKFHLYTMGYMQHHAIEPVQMVQNLETMEISRVIPSYRDAVGFYLREDVSEVLWQMSRRRVLKFFYFADDDIKMHGTKARHLKIHCFGTPGDLRDRISEVTKGIRACPFPFFPFFGMKTEANLPGHPEIPTGWDMRFEVDFNLAYSFQALIPVVAVLEHFRVPVIAKFSGHRSLHVIIPAEAFPPRMTSAPDHGEWMAAFEKLAKFLFQVAPGLVASHPFKDLELTAPYSLHRYHGLVGLPLSASEALEFKPCRADLAAVREVSWRPDDHLRATHGIENMLPFVDQCAGRGEILRELCAEVFAGRRWEKFCQNALPSDMDPESVEARLFAGFPGQRHGSPRVLKKPSQAARYWKALEVIDGPNMKNMKLYRLVASIGFVMAFETWQQIRLSLCEFLALWVKEGINRAFQGFMQLACSESIRAPAGLAVRVAGNLPERKGLVVRTLKKLWDEVHGLLTPGSAFVALALAEHSRSDAAILDILCRESSAYTKAVRSYLMNDISWETERRPDLAIAALLLAFPQLRASHENNGMDDGGMVLVSRYVFGGDLKKVEYAFKRLHSFISKYESSV
jgi:hypothetical protein